MPNVKIAFSCRAAPPAGWPEAVGQSDDLARLRWATVRVSLDPLSITISDDQDQAVILDCSKSSRPSGEFETESWKIALVFLRVAKDLGFSVVLGDSDSVAKLDDLHSLRGAIAPECSAAVFEDHAFDIRLVPAAFRLRHLPPIVGGIDVSL